MASVVSNLDTPTWPSLSLQHKECDAREQNIFDRVIKNPLFWVVTTSLALVAVTVLTFTVSPFFALTGVVLVAFLATIIYQNRVWLQHETALIGNLFMNTFVGWCWWNEINEDIVLGALPLKSNGHVDKLITKERVGAVLSLVEPFESEEPGLLHTPVTPSDWTSRGVAFKQVAVVDTTAPEVDRIHEAVAFIKEQIDLGKRVYVHCKAGIGRSAVMVMCYLLKHGGFTDAKEAVKHVQSQRSQVSFCGSHQKQCVHDYFAGHCQKA